MITLGDILCIKFLDSNTTFKIYRERELIYDGSYTEMDNALFSTFVVAFSFKTYKNEIKVALL